MEVGNGRPAMGAVDAAGREGGRKCLKKGLNIAARLRLDGIEGG